MNKGTREPTAAVHLAQSSELLGLPRDARVLIINADDFGMYQAVSTAVIRSIEEGSFPGCSLRPAWTKLSLSSAPRSTRWPTPG